MENNSENFKVTYDNLIKKYNKNMKQMKVIETSSAVDIQSADIKKEIDSLISENNGIILQLSDLQKNVTNDNYKLQQELSVLGEELNDVQLKNEQLKKRLQDTKDKSLTTKGLEEQTSSINVSKFIFLIKKLLLLVLLIYIIYRVQGGTTNVTNVATNVAAISAAANNIQKSSNNKNNKNSKNNKNNNNNINFDKNNLF